MKKLLIIVLSVLILLIGGMIAVQTFHSQQEKDVGPIYSEEIGGVTYEYDICYKNTEVNNCYLDIAYRPGDEKKPLLMFVHGGFWITGDKKNMHNFFYTFAGRGYTVANINYDMVSFDKDKLGRTSILDEEACVEAAIGFLVENAEKYSIDTDNVFLAGHSAGGQLVGRVIEITNHPIKGAILMSAASDFRYMLYNNVSTVDDIVVNPALIPFMFDGETKNDIITAIDKVDVLANLHEGMPKTLILHGDFDELLPYTMSQRLGEKMRELGMDARVEIVHEMEHNPEVTEVSDLIEEFILETKEGR